MNLDSYNYSKTDHEVWHQLYRQQARLIKTIACREYLDGFRRFHLPADHALSLSVLNERIEHLTPWRFVPARGLLKPSTFFISIYQHELPVTLQMRKPQEIHFSELPDLFHDLFGHAPALFSPTISNLYERFASIAIRHINDETFIARLAKLFWVAFEVGLIEQDGDLKVYGGAILSSSGEIDNIFNAATPVRSLDLTSVLSYHYDPLVLQNEYFAIRSFDALQILPAELEREYYSSAFFALNRE